MERNCRPRGGSTGITFFTKFFEYRNFFLGAVDKHANRRPFCSEPPEHSRILPNKFGLLVVRLSEIIKWSRV
jgi:hypothetical protein